MQVDYVLILAAGKGTRMGSIGKQLPKLLWPVFETPLFELQVLFAKRLAPKAKIFMNTYYYADKILAAIDKSKIKNKFELISEQEPLDIGGAIHNLAKKLNYSGTLLILNGDQFLTIKRSQIENALNKLSVNDQVLFSYPVNSSEGYNALNCDSKGRFKGVVHNSLLPPAAPVQTYTGTSLISLNKLLPMTGKSNFFESIANSSKYMIQTESLEDFEYWDFGTLDRYHRSHYELLANNNSSFLSFLKKSGAIKPKKLALGSYGGTSGINLSGQENFKIPHGGIVISEPGDITLPVKGKFISHGKIIDHL